MPAIEPALRRQRLRTRARRLGLAVTRDRRTGWTFTGPDGMVTGKDLDDATADDLPAFTPPEPEVPPPSLAPLVSSEWDYAGQCRALRESKAYGGSD